ncbi:MAG: sulfotransferase [Xanthomonadales bacterium]|nr:sulfotransferase [Xanthomonadales bacterium]
MPINISQMSVIARKAVTSQDWETVAACATSILQHNANSAEGYFLTGLVEKVNKRLVIAIQAFEKTLDLDANRYDAAVELASQYSISRRNKEVAELLERYTEKLNNSPIYLDFAGTIYSEIGLPEKAWPLFVKANQLQPGVDLFQANLAACGLYFGKVEESRDIYRALLKRFPNHQRNHYQLARTATAEDRAHIDQMQEILKQSDATADRNIFMYYALAKELEDLKQWQESFRYYKQAGDAVCSVAKYDVANDIALIDKVIEVCNADWISDNTVESGAKNSKKTPIFIVGLPRTGTTLTERIVSSHSQVESVGETLFLQMVLRRESGVHGIENMNPEMIESLAQVDPGLISTGYLEQIDYRLGESAFFIDKLPFNFLFLGFIVKAWPDARIIRLDRNPLDTCFSMFKQVFTWAYKFSYSLEDLGKYYVAYQRLHQHWSEVLEDRLIEVEYESLVSDTENQTRILLDKLGLEFEQNCLNFDKNTAPSTTASSVQVREKTHSRSIQRWQRFRDQLQPLKTHLENAGIKVE